MHDDGLRHKMYNHNHISALKAPVLVICIYHTDTGSSLFIYFLKKLLRVFDVSFQLEIKAENFHRNSFELIFFVVFQARKI
jgi:hypothetical protein